jgi:hypothetical protein
MRRELNGQSERASFLDLRFDRKYAKIIGFLARPANVWPWRADPGVLFSCNTLDILRSALHAPL